MLTTISSSVADATHISFGCVRMQFKQLTFWMHSTCRSQCARWDSGRVIEMTGGMETVCVPMRRCIFNWNKAIQSAAGWLVVAGATGKWSNVWCGQSVLISFHFVYIDRDTQPVVSQVRARVFISTHTTAMKCLSDSISRNCSDFHLDSLFFSVEKILTTRSKNRAGKSNLIPYIR